MCRGVISPATLLVVIIETVRQTNQPSVTSGSTPELTIRHASLLMRPLEALPLARNKKKLSSNIFLEYTGKVYKHR